MSGLDFRNPSQEQYEAIYRAREERMAQIRSDPAYYMLRLREFYRENPAEFINDWGVTFDPRAPEIGLQSFMPFVLFDKQREWVEWVMRHWRGRKGGVTEKSRDMGMSWLAVALSCALCIFIPGVMIGFGSRKEEYVDLAGDPRALFTKARMFLGLLSVEFRAAGATGTRRTCASGSPRPAPSSPARRATTSAVATAPSLGESKRTSVRIVRMISRDSRRRAIAA